MEVLFKVAIVLTTAVFFATIGMFIVAGIYFWAEKAQRAWSRRKLEKAGGFRFLTQSDLNIESGDHWWNKPD